MQKTLVFPAASFYQTRNILKCSVGFIVQENKTFSLFHVKQTDAAGRTDIFLHSFYLENEAKKRQDILNTPKNVKFGAVLAMANFSQKSLLTFLHQTLQLLVNY